MPDFKYKGYSYEKIIHNTNKGKKYEYIKWVSGFRNLWDRISESEFNNAKKLKYE